MKTYAFGFPKLGKGREFKFALENFWQKKLTEQELIKALKKIDESRIKTYERWVDDFPRGEVSLYDVVLDHAVLFGVYPVKSFNEYFELCRGSHALELKKWFDTNYHYLVPNFQGKKPNFEINLGFLKNFKSWDSKGYFLAPFTFLKLCKGLKQKYFSEALQELTQLLVKFFNEAAFEEVHLDDPVLVTELTEEDWKAIKKAYQEFEACKARVNLFTYYDGVEGLKVLFELPIAGIGLDLVRGKNENLKQLEEVSSSEKQIFAGVINGRNVWRSDLFSTARLLEHLAKKFEVIITNSCPLFHLPISLEGATLPEELLKKVAFAEEKLKEIKLLKDVLEGRKEQAEEWTAELGKDFGKLEEVRHKVASLKEEDFVRVPEYSKRKLVQKQVLNLPLFPTTTIGSFPQTEDVRRIRRLYKGGQISKEVYETFLKGEIAKVVKIQEELGLDVLVHGEFERSDMVEFFAEKLKGIACTGNGWVISYGTRCYRPPIIFGDIKREEPMTLREISFAQSLTEKPVKGMLTGPVTIIAWSYVREDIPVFEVAYQLALAIKEEIADYEKAGIKVVQIDEPAIRERAPIKKKKWNDYFNWAIKAFRLCHSSVSPEVQVHTHMCYSDFSEIIEYVLEMDFDVISIEAFRSKGEIIESFERINFDREIGLGVWDIHSPRVPLVEEMKEVVKRALEVIPKESFWINPDCGLKTRRWEEVIPALVNIVKLAKELRENFLN